MVATAKRYAPLPVLALAIAACGDVTGTPSADSPLVPTGIEASVVSAQSASATSNGQLFLSSPLAGFGVVNFPEACFVFDMTFGEPDSWFRATQEDIVTMEHHVVQNGLLLVGSFFTGLQGGSGHGTLNGRYARDGTFRGATISVNGTLDDGRAVSCKLVVTPSGEVSHSTIRVGGGS